MKKLFISILLPFVLLSCSPNLDMLGMFYGQSPRNDERFEASMLYNEEHGYPVITVYPLPLIFMWIHPLTICSVGST